jgi:hypothetical protein
MEFVPCECCPHCGASSFTRLLVCPSCHQTGCDGCMPEGWGSPCPACERTAEQQGPSSEAQDQKKQSA